MRTRSDIKRENGVVLIPRDADEAFRKALMDGVPPSLRPKMREALAATPDPNAIKAIRHSRRYFGEEASKIFADASGLAAELHRFLAGRFQLNGLLDWLTATGYGNDYRMIKVFAEWARMAKASEKKLIIP